MTSRLEEISALADQTKGFLSDAEGRALHRAGHLVGGDATLQTWVEIGAWCGKSTAFLGLAAQEVGATLFSVDHHHGSEEQQRGWPYFDEELVDPADGRLNTLPHWQRTIALAGLENAVVGIVGDSTQIAPHFEKAIGLLFLDGGHGEEIAWSDFRRWQPKIAIEGLLLLHDVFPDPRDGGRPPFEIFETALASGDYELVLSEGSLRGLRRRRNEHTW